MIGNLKQYIKKLWKEYDKAMTNHIEYELMENYDRYYIAQAHMIRAVIYDLTEMLGFTHKEQKELFKERGKINV